MENLGLQCKHEHKGPGSIRGKNLGESSGPDTASLAFVVAHQGVFALSSKLCGVFLVFARCCLCPSEARCMNLSEGQAPERARVLTGAEDVVRSAVFSPDGYFVLTATSAGNAKIWNVPRLQTLRGTAQELDACLDLRAL